MSKKNKKEQQEAPLENYYDLKKDQIDELVEALKTGEGKGELTTNIAEITGEETGAKPGSKKAEFDPYRRDKLSALPTWLKAIFIKFWFAGVVCYFVFFGLSQTLENWENLILVAGLLLGILVDLMVNPIFRMLESDKKEYNNYMMFPFPFKAYWTFLTNIIYYVVVLFVVTYMYTGLNLIINAITGAAESLIQVGVEPLLFGLFAVIADMAFIGIKDLIVWLVKCGAKKRRSAADLVGEDAMAGSPNEADGATAYTETAPESVGENPAGSANTSNNSNANNNDNNGGEVDEVEKLRLLAEEKNSAKSAAKGDRKNK